MAIFRVPVENTPQTFDISLAGIEYIVTCKYNDAFEGGWALDIKNGEDNESLINYIPLVTGVNLLDGLEYLGINGSLFVQTDGDQLAVPTLLNLGVESFLFFVTED